MRKIRDYIYQSSADFTKSMLWELKYIFRDKPVFFSFIIVSILVSFLYTYLYSKETLEKLPIGVVDEDNTAGSRQLLRMVDATSQTQIIENYLNEEKFMEYLLFLEAICVNYREEINLPFQCMLMLLICCIINKYLHLLRFRQHILM